MPTEDLQEFVFAAVERSKELFERYFEEADRDPRNASYRSASFIFGGILKGHPEVGDLPAAGAVQSVDELLEPRGGWRLFPNEDVFGNECDPRNNFIESWDVLKVPLLCTPVPSQAMLLVERWPLESKHWPSPNDQDYRRLVSLCYWFARLLDDDGRFFLACRTAEPLIGVSHVTAASLLRRACRPGEPLKLTRRGDRWRGASEYQFKFGAVELTEAREVTQ